MYPLETNSSRDVRKLKGQYKVKDMPKKRLPAIMTEVYGWKKQKGELEQDGIA